jgi:hypothetical protein
MKEESEMPFDSATPDAGVKVVTMTRLQKFQRWIEVLRQRGEERIANLRRLEYRDAATTAVYREENSILTVAANDPVLKDAGLKNDTVGEAKRFFELQDYELHSMSCNCIYEDTSTGTQAANLLQRHIDGGVVR